jgi:hypothetical protein
MLTIPTFRPPRKPALGFREVESLLTRSEISGHYEHMGFDLVGGVSSAGIQRMRRRDGGSAKYTYRVRDGRFYDHSHRECDGRGLSLCDTLSHFLPNQYPTPLDALRELASRHAPAQHHAAPRPPAPKAPTPPPVPPAHWQKTAEVMRQSGLREWLPADLGVTPESLARLGCGSAWEAYEIDGQWCNDKQVASFPLRDGQGRVVGILTRDHKGHKKLQQGGRHGLSYDPDTIPDSGLVPVVEGPSDGAACLDMGVWALGRSMHCCEDNVAQAAELFRGRPGLKPVVVLERDAKDGSFPGRDQGCRYARELAALLGRPVLVAFPPPGYKDTRQWYNSRRAEGADPADLGREFLAHVEAHACEPTPIPHTETPPPAGTGGPGGAAPRETGSAATKAKKPPPEPPPDWFVRRCHRQAYILMRPKAGAHHEGLAANPNTRLAVAADCKSLACPHCGWHCRKRWAKHVAEVLGKVAGPVYRCEVTEEERSKLLKRLERREGDPVWVSVRRQDGRYVFYSTAPPAQGRERPPENGPAVVLPAAQAAAEAAKCIKGTPLEVGKRFIGASKNVAPKWGAWKDAVPEEWSYEARLNVHPSVLKAAARRAGIPCLDPEEERERERVEREEKKRYSAAMLARLDAEREAERERRESEREPGVTDMLYLIPRRNFDFDDWITPFIAAPGGEQEDPADDWTFGEDVFTGTGPPEAAAAGGAGGGPVFEDAWADEVYAWDKGRREAAAAVV